MNHKPKWLKKPIVIIIAIVAFIAIGTIGSYYDFVNEAEKDLTVIIGAILVRLIFIGLVAYSLSMKHEIDKNELEKQTHFIIIFPRRDLVPKEEAYVFNFFTDHGLSYLKDDYELNDAELEIFIKNAINTAIYDYRKTHKMDQQ